jgi:hypothetical protein
MDSYVHDPDKKAVNECGSAPMISISSSSSLVASLTFVSKEGPLDPEPLLRVLLTDQVIRARAGAERVLAARVADLPDAFLTLEL